jgi:3,4-dihydroxy 2-butanone 4-phosphate synthase/GTP cyclohydrolase II
VRANSENIRYLMTKRDRMGHDLVGLEDYDEAVSMDDYDEAVYLLGDRRPPSATDSGSSL